MKKNNLYQLDWHMLVGRTVIVVITIMLIIGTTPVVSTDVRAETGKEMLDVRGMIAKAEKQVNKTEDGRVAYIVSSNNKLGQIRNKYKSKLMGVNKNTLFYQNDCLSLVGITTEEFQQIDSDEDTIIEKDYMLKGSTTPEDHWQKSLDYVVDGSWDVKAVQAHNIDISKSIEKKVKVAVLDSGADKLSAETLAGGINFTESDEDSFGEDSTGHGTAVQNIILSDGETTTSVMEEDSAIELYSVKVLDENNEAPISRVVAAIQWCIDNEFDIINMSFGTLAESQILHDMIRKAYDKGILMVAAAGNGGEATGSTVEYPAAYSEVLGVGAVNQKMEISDFSSKGKEVDLVAPGENIPITVPWGFYGIRSGTSFAAPHVTAVAALLWSQSKSKTAYDIASLLRDSANDAWNEIGSGNGMVDYQYAQDILDVYVSKEYDKISNTNEKHLTKYAVPEIVQARWEANDRNLYQDKNGDKALNYTHKALLGDGDKPTNISAVEYNYLRQVVTKADSSDLLTGYSNKSLSTCRVMHAGRYGNQYTNYVAACRCLYNCAYLIRYNSNNEELKNELKEYSNKHYKSNEQSAASIDDTKKDLRILINLAWSENYGDDAENLKINKRRELNFVGFALHLAADAFAHQYVIPPNDASSIVNNSRLERLNGVMFNKLTVSDYSVNEIAFGMVGKEDIKNRISSGQFVNKELEVCFEQEKKKEEEKKKPDDKRIQKLELYRKRSHKFYCDNVSYAYDRYRYSAKDAVVQLISMYASNPVMRFNPLIFVNHIYNGSGNNGRTPVWNLRYNVKYAGYTPSDYVKANITVGTMEQTWNQLSWWK